MTSNSTMTRIQADLIKPLKIAAAQAGISSQKLLSDIVRAELARRAEREGRTK